MLTRYLRWLALIALAENFAVLRLISVRPSVTPDAVSTWQKRERAWSQSTGVQLSSYKRWQSLSGFIEARNAIQHGLGNLTDRQLGENRTRVLSQLKSAGV